MKNILCLSILVSFLSLSSAFAAVSPVAISIGGPVQFPPNDFNIMGARISVLYGKHRDVSGLDVGLLGNITTGKFTGAAVSGLFNKTAGPTTILGLQLAGLANINTQKTRVFGLQAALGTNYNTAESSVVGVQLALANLSPNTNIYGFQMGLYNKARAVRGFQIGLINVTQNLSGIQIGLLNFYQEGFFKVSPIINIGF